MSTVAEVLLTSSTLKKVITIAPSLLLSKYRCLKRGENVFVFIRDEFILILSRTGRLDACEKFTLKKVSFHRGKSSRSFK